MGLVLIRSVPQEFFNDSLFFLGLAVLTIRKDPDAKSWAPTDARVEGNTV